VIKPETAMEQLFFTTARLQCQKSDEAWSGTGFFTTIPVTNGDDQAILVTNRHVVSSPGIGNADEIQIIAPAGLPPYESDRPMFGQSATLTVQNPTFETHVNDKVDVAAMLINELPFNGPYRLYTKSLPVEYFINDDALDTLDALEEVTFIGYPSAIYDTVNMTPIARHGWTATPVSLDYAGDPAFLIDASVFPGSSGSPVFIVNKGSYTHRLGATIPVMHRVILLGIVAAVYQREEEGRLIPALNLPRVTVNQPLNLGIVYKTRTILETIDKLLAANGMSRRPTDPLAPSDLAPVSTPAISPAIAPNQDTTSDNS
jgi:hypothetical protein